MMPVFLECTLYLKSHSLAQTIQVPRVAHDLGRASRPHAEACVVGLRVSVSRSQMHVMFTLWSCLKAHHYVHSLT